MLYSFHIIFAWIGNPKPHLRRSRLAAVFFVLLGRRGGLHIQTDTRNANSQAIYLTQEGVNSYSPQEGTMALPIWLFASDSERGCDSKRIINKNQFAMCFDCCTFLRNIWKHINYSAFVIVPSWAFHSTRDDSKSNIINIYIYIYIYVYIGLYFISIGYND